MEAREANLLRSVTETTWRYYAWVGCLLLVLGWGLVAYVHQFRNGLIVTGLRDQVSWGLYITNFVFFIGISHAGTLISAILRVTQTEWRRPITRMAEAITVFALCIGGPMVIIDLGRPDRIPNLFLYPRIQSPIIWDVLSVTTYLAGCVLYFYIPMIPDLAMLADRPEISGWRRWLYRKLSLGWRGTKAQQHLLEKAISTMAVMIIPLAVSVHTVVSWIFAMTLRPGWDSSIFGPYFVIGAIYSGAAAVIFSMWVLRKIYGFEDYVEPKHFRNLGLMLLAFALLYLYFNINEYLTVGYKLEGFEKELVRSLFVGKYATAFWTVQAVGVFIPILLMLTVLAWKRYQHFTIPGVVLASALAVVGAWAKRYLIVIPTMQTPFLPAQRVPAEWTHYRPTWVEWSITAAAVAGFLLIYTLLAKFFPIISIWETREADETQPAREEAVTPSRWWKPGRATVTMLLIGLLLVPTSARAGAKPSKAPKPTALSVEWQEVSASQAASIPEEQGETIPAGRNYWYAGRIFDPLRWLSSSTAEDEKPGPAIQLTAALRDAAGTPVTFKSVEFSLRTAFGTLPFGSRPTTEDGKATLVVRDRRFGTYPVLVTFKGDDEYASTRVEIPVKFPEKPSPGLPRVGVLITPYATPAIGLPFLAFYGTMWVVFTYAFGYLILYRMRREGRPKIPSAPEIHEGTRSPTPTG